MTTTDTPRTCPHCGDQAQADKENMHDYIRKLLSFVYMEMPSHPRTQKFVHQYFDEIQS